MKLQEGGIMFYRVNSMLFVCLIALYIFFLMFSRSVLAQEDNPYWYIDPEGKKVTFTPIDSVILLNFEVMIPDSTKVSPKTGLPEKKPAGTPEKRVRVLQELRKLGYELRKIPEHGLAKLPPFALKDSIDFEIIPLFRRAGFRKPEQSQAFAKALEGFTREQNQKLGEKIVADVLPAFQCDSDGQIFFFRPNTVMVKIRGYIKRGSINHLFERESLEVLTQKWEYPEYYQARLYTCKLPAGRPFFASLQELARQPEVRFAIPRKLIGGLSEILPYTKGEGIWEEDPPFIKKLGIDVRDFYRAFATEDPEMILRRWRIYFPFEEETKPPSGSNLAVIPRMLSVGIAFFGSYSDFSDRLKLEGIQVPGDSSLRELYKKRPFHEVGITLDIHEIIRIAAWPQVRNIGLPTLPTLHSNSNPIVSNQPVKASVVTSEGVALIEANKYHDLQVNGQKVKVGILDGGFASSDIAAAAGEISSVDINHRFPTDASFFSGANHGTRVAEIVYDVAPSAELFYYKLQNCFTNTWNQAFEWFQQRGVRIINISLSCPPGRDPFQDPIGEPGDGTGFINSVFYDFLLADPKLSIFVSAGNVAQQHHEKVYTAFGRTGFAEEFGSFGFPETTDIYHNFTHLDDDASIGVLQRQITDLGGQFSTVLRWFDQNTQNPRYWDFDLLLLQGLDDDSVNTSPYNATSNPTGSMVASSSAPQPPPVLMSDSSYKFYNWEGIRFDFAQAKPFAGSCFGSGDVYDMFHLVVRNTQPLIFPPPPNPYDLFNPPFNLEVYTNNFKAPTVFPCNSSGWAENLLTKTYTDFEQIKVPLGSIVDPPADNPIVCAIGSFVAVSNPDEGDAGEVSNISSRGPNNEVSPFSLTRTGPDWLAPTQVSTYTSGSNKFGGTSAAAPHSAGAAALLRALDSNLSATDIYQILCDSAEWMPGIDFETQGCGKLKMPFLRMRGDVNQDGFASLADVLLLLNHVFDGQPLPPPGDPRVADLNCDGQAFPSDVVIQLNWVFSGNTLPCPFDSFLKIAGSNSGKYRSKVMKKNQANQVQAEAK